MWIATEKDYIEEFYKPSKDSEFMCQRFTADDIPGLPERTYLMWHLKDSPSWKEQRDFVEEYWRKVKMTEKIDKEKPKQMVEKDILEERQETYGSFEDVALISQEFEEYFREQPSWESLTDVQKEALDNIAQKIARIFAGDPNFADHWIDIQDYAKLAQQEIEKNGDRPSSLK